MHHKNPNFFHLLSSHACPACLLSARRDCTASKSSGNMRSLVFLGLNWFFSLHQLFPLKYQSLKWAFLGRLASIGQIPEKGIITLFKTWIWVIIIPLWPDAQGTGWAQKKLNVYRYEFQLKVKHNPHYWQSYLKTSGVCAFGALEISLLWVEGWWI